MIISNFIELVSKPDVESEVQARKTILELLDIGINSVLPRNLIPKAVSLKNKILRIKDQVYHLSDVRNIYVIGAGKASGAMAQTLESEIGLEVTNGLINIPMGTKNRYKTKMIQLNEASHPIPSTNQGHLQFLLLAHP